MYYSVTFTTFFLLRLGLTCKEIRLLENSALSALDASELETLSDEEFTSCLDVLGVVEGLTQEQYAALAGRAKKVIAR